MNRLLYKRALLSEIYWRRTAAPQRVVIAARGEEVAPTLHLEMHDRHVQEHGSDQEKAIGILDRTP